MYFKEIDLLVVVVHQQNCHESMDNYSFQVLGKWSFSKLSFKKDIHGCFYWVVKTELPNRWDNFSGTVIAACSQYVNGHTVEFTALISNSK